MYIDIDYIDTLIRKIMPLPSEVNHYVYAEPWLDEDDRRFNFHYKKIWHTTEFEVYCIGWELVNVKEI